MDKQTNGLALADGLISFSPKRKYTKAKSLIHTGSGGE